jgi:hypothetical protein
MIENISQAPNRRIEPTTRRQNAGETTSFDLSTIQAARKHEDELAPIFLVCHGVQKGRPIPIHAGPGTIGRGPLCDISIQGR